MCIDMCSDLCIDLCSDVCVDMCRDALFAHVLRHVFNFGADGADFDAGVNACYVWTRGRDVVPPDGTVRCRRPMRTDLWSMQF